MSIAPNELENIASRYAAEAIRLDSQGSRPLAIQYYQKAVDYLLKLVKLYPDYKLNNIYMERAKAYQNRIRALQEIRTYEDVDDNNGNANSTEMKAEFDELIMNDKPNIKLDEVVGLEDAKTALKESIVYPSERPDLFPLGWPRGILLYGPPGNGKTMLAAATASEIKGYFINVDAASMMSKWLGEAEKNVAKLFSMARRLTQKENVPVILFIDELDSLLGSRSNEIGGEVRVKNQFLTEMDGINSKGSNMQLYVIGATNKPWSLDWPFLRRFQKRIFVGLPNYEARLKMFTQYTAPLNKDASLSLEELAKESEGYSASDIRDVCQSVQLKVVNELFANHKENEATTRSVTNKDFIEMLKNRKPSVSQEMLKAYQRWTEQFKAL